MPNYVMKDLFVPFREQKMKMQVGKKYVIHIPTQEGMNYDPKKTVPYERKWVID